MTIPLWIKKTTPSSYYRIIVIEIKGRHLIHQHNFRRAAGLQRLAIYFGCPWRRSSIVFLSPVYPRTLSFSCWTKWQILLWNLMKFEIESQGYNILSSQAVRGMMVPSRPNYDNGDTCNCSDPKGVFKAAMNLAALLLHLKVFCFFFLFISK